LVGASTHYSDGAEGGRSVMEMIIYSFESDDSNDEAEIVEEKVMMMMMMMVMMMMITCLLNLPTSLIH